MVQSQLIHTDEFPWSTPAYPLNAQRPLRVSSIQENSAFALSNPHLPGRRPPCSWSMTRPLGHVIKTVPSKGHSLNIKHKSDKPSILIQNVHVCLLYNFYMKDPGHRPGHRDLKMTTPTFLFCFFCKNQILSAFSTISSFNLLKELIEEEFTCIKNLIPET